MKLLHSAAALMFALAASLAAAEAPKHEANLAASGQAVLDVVEGRVEMAPVSVPYGQALAAAHRQATAAGKRFAPPPSLRFHEISKSGDAVLSVVTIGTPSEDARQAIAFLRAREARPVNVMPVRNR